MRRKAEERRRNMEGGGRRGAEGNKKRKEKGERREWRRGRPKIGESGSPSGRLKERAEGEERELGFRLGRALLFSTLSTRSKYV